MPKIVFFSQLLTKKFLKNSKLQIHYENACFESFVLFGVKTKNKAIFFFKHDTVHRNGFLLCLKSFCYVSIFPNFQSLCAYFPNSEGPALIPKILKTNTVHL